MLLSFMFLLLGERSAAHEVSRLHRSIALASARCRPYTEGLPEVHDLLKYPSQFHDGTRFISFHLIIGRHLCTTLTKIEHVLSVLDELGFDGTQLFLKSACVAVQTISINSTFFFQLQMNKFQTATSATSNSNGT